jgi:hypothetical protein
MTFTHYMYGTWNKLVDSRGIAINNDTNTKLVVDDTLSLAKE